MTTKTLLSLATVALLAATSQADTTSSVVTTEDWFTESVSNYTVGDLPSTTKGTWTTPTAGEAEVKTAGKISLDTAPNDPLTFAPTAWSGIAVSEYSFLAKIESLTRSAENPSISGTPFGALVAVGSSWKGFVDGAWQTLSGATPPEDGESCFVRIDVLPSTTAAKVRYSVGATEGSLTTLTYNDSSLLDAGKEGTAIDHLAYAGCATLGDIKSVVKSTVTVTIPTTDMSPETKAALATLVGQTVDSVAFQNALASNEKLGNGLTMLESVILGVPGTTANDKPFTAPVQTSNSKLGFTIGNVDTNKYGTDATVTFGVYPCDAEGNITSGTAKATANANATAEFEPEDGVKYYKIKITITK